MYVNDSFSVRISRNVRKRNWCEHPIIHSRILHTLHMIPRPFLHIMPRPHPRSVTPGSVEVMEINRRLVIHAMTKRAPVAITLQRPSHSTLFTESSEIYCHKTSANKTQELTPLEMAKSPGHAYPLPRDWTERDSMTSLKNLTVPTVQCTNIETCDATFFNENCAHIPPPVEMPEQKTDVIADAESISSVL